jgi:predicted methyltransferase
VAPQFRTSPEMSPEHQLAILSSAGIDPNEKIVKLMMGGGFGTEQANHILNSRAAHAAEIPSANGIGNARSLAKMYAATIGEIDGVRLLQTRSVDRARVPQTRLEAGTHADVKDIGGQDAQEQQLLNAGFFKTGSHRARRVVLV